MKIKKSPVLDVVFALSLGLLFSTVVPAATLVVANKAEATASLIDLASGEVVATLPTGQGPHEVAISPDGRHALVTDYGVRGSEGSSLTLIDIARAEVVKTIDLGEYRRPHGILYTSDDRVLVTAEANKALIEVDLTSGEVVSVFDTAQEISHMVDISADGGRAYVANIGSGSVTVIDLEKGERVANVETGEGAEGVAVAGGKVWVTNRAADTVTVLDAQSLEKLADFDSEGFPIRATATSKGQVLVTRARAGDLVIYDASSHEEVRRVEFDLASLGSDGRLFGDRFGDSSVPIGVVPNGDGTRAFVAHANADVITEIDLAEGAIVRTLRAGKEPDGMGWSSQAVNVRTAADPAAAD